MVNGGVVGGGNMWGIVRFIILPPNIDVKRIGEVQQLLMQDRDRECGVWGLVTGQEVY